MASGSVHCARCGARHSGACGLFLDNTIIDNELVILKPDAQLAMGAPRRPDADEDRPLCGSELGFSPSTGYGTSRCRNISCDEQVPHLKTRRHSHLYSSLDPPQELNASIVTYIRGCHFFSNPPVEQ